MKKLPLFEAKEDIRYEFINLEDTGEDDEFDMVAAADEAEVLAKKEGINILRGKELIYVALDEQDKVVGALWTEVDHNEFSFDVAVSKSHQRQGIGDKLVKLAISEYGNVKDMYDDLSYKVDVTNPNMEKLLAKHGFKEVERITGHTIMTKE